MGILMLSRRPVQLIGAVAIATALLLTTTPAIRAQNAAIMTGVLKNIEAEGGSFLPITVWGQCDSKSHVSRGPIGKDISGNAVPFLCDVAVLAIYDKAKKHVMVNFAQTGHTKGMLAFSGFADAKAENVFDIDKVYLDPGVATYFDVAVCKFFFSGRHMSGIFCGGKRDADGERTFASIVFNAKPGQ